MNGAYETWIVEHLGVLAELRGESVTPARAVAYAEELSRFPQSILVEAFRRLRRDEERRFPTLGQVLAAIREVLIEGGVLEAPDGAFRRAKREARAYDRITRPDPDYSSPAIRRCVSELGGPEAFVVADEVGEGILRRAFLAAYARHAMSDEHLRFVAEHGTYAVPRPVRGLEVPHTERDRLIAHAEAHERTLPAWVYGETTTTPALPTRSGGNDER